MSADRRDEIASWLQRRDREFVVVLGETSGWWTEADVDAVVAEAAAPATPAFPDHRPPITQARPRAPRPTAAPPAVTAVTLEAPDGQRGTLIGPASKVAGIVRPEAVVDQLTPVYGEHVGYDDDEDPAAQQVAGVTADVGEVDPPEDVHPTQLPDQRGERQVDDPAPRPAGVVHRAPGRDVLAEGLAHPDPDVVAAAQVARLAIDRLVTQLQRHTTRGAHR